MDCGGESAHCELKEETSNVCLTTHCLQSMLSEMLMTTTMMVWIKMHTYLVVYDIISVWISHPVSSPFSYPPLSFSSSFHF